MFSLYVEIGEPLSKLLIKEWKDLMDRRSRTYAKDKPDQ